MKASRFNTFIDLPGGTRLIHNSRSLALAELDSQSDQLVEKILADPDGPVAADNGQLVRQLAYGGYLVGRDLDEVGLLKVEDGIHRFGRRIFSVAIAPTFECNLACGYCGARNRRGRITKPIEKALSVWAARFIRKADEIHLTWFGGEPLLCVDTIERIQCGLAEQAAQHKISVSYSNVITNGYMLDAAMADRLKKIGISSAQVTLDGPPAVHNNRRRHSSDGSATFERIVANVGECCEKLSLAVRINVDPEKPEQGAEVVEILSKLGLLSRVGVYFAAMPAGAESICADAAEKCRPGWNLVDWQIRLLEKLPRTKGMNGGLDRAMVQRCSFGSDSAFIVAPSGYLFKCWEEVGSNVDRSVGSVFVDDDAEEFQADNLWKFTSFDPFENPACNDCDILPVCLGGCPLDMELRTTEIGSKCSLWKGNLNQMLSVKYLLARGEEVSR